APAIESTSELVVPTISIYEVFKRVLQQRTENEALQAVVTMQQGLVVDLGVTLALEAATLSHQLKLPMADSIMLATARSYGAVLWTQDSDFRGIEVASQKPRANSKNSPPRPSPQAGRERFPPLAGG
ncbi:MAG: type II toxin-antitoxin system VapC family toxin, partial [Pseudomonadota bacterium]